jgi:dimethylglycine dehydrogenase
MLARQPRSRIALLALEGEDTEALIGEAVFKEGFLVGSVTSAAYGYTVEHSLAIAFLSDDARQAGTELEVSILGRRVRARVLPDAPWDPNNNRLKV